MLRGNYNRVYSDGLVVLVIFDSDLRFSVGSEIRERAVLSDLCQLCGELVCQGYRHGHKLRRLIACKAEHHALVAGTLSVNTESYVGRLLVNGGQHSTGVAVKSLFRAVVADIADDLTCYFRDVDIAACADFAHNHDNAGCAAALACNSAVLVLLEDSVKHSV